MASRTLIALFISLSLLLAASACGEVPGELDYEDIPEMPPGIEGERIQLFIDAVNGADESLMLRFYDECFSEQLKERLPRESVPEFLVSIARETGGIDFHSVRRYDPPWEDQTVAIYRSRNYESWEALVLRYAEGEKPDGLLVGVRLNDARPPSDVEPAGPLTQAELIEETRGFIERLCANDLFSGTVLIAKGDDVLFEHACGEASKRFHARIDMDTKFNLGSMNKMMTATAIMQLVEKGLVSVDDPLGKYADESWFPKETSDRITIHHLLTHTSGLGNYFNETFEQGSRLRWRELDDYRDLVSGDTLAFEPGTDRRYSNTGMFMLGVVVESATGENYFEYMREHVYGPAGMEDTDCYDMDCPVENLAIGYWQPWGPAGCSSGWKNNYYEHVIRGGPAGGGFSTCPDLHRFARALETGVLLAAESRELLWTDHFDQNYGYGFGVADGPAGKVVGHGGGFTGINANLDIFVDGGYIVAVMTNYDQAADAVAATIGELVGRVE